MQPSCDARRCPLCGADNRCVRAVGGAGPCWCEAVAFDPATLARVPAAARDRACLCRACAGGDGRVSSSAAPAARPSGGPPGP
ncbi:MAG: cysteine-rich CWC family protein [Planctomycetes bacterium]|nr:cysteine-rich CWC family protein [Planctomycetota bacterium]